jgi:hypothetical protein
MFFAVLTLHHTLVIGALGLIICVLSEARPAVKAVKSRFEKLRGRVENIAEEELPDSKTEKKSAPPSPARKTTHYARWARSEEKSGTLTGLSQLRRGYLPIRQEIESPAVEDYNSSSCEETVDSEDTDSWTCSSSTSQSDVPSESDRVDDLEKGLHRQNKDVAIIGPWKSFSIGPGNPVLSLIGLFVGLFQLLVVTLTCTIPLICKEMQVGPALTLESDNGKPASGKDTVVAARTTQR